jgi:hypothetical protein
MPTRHIIAVTLLVSWAGFTNFARAQQAPTPEDRIAALERRVELLSRQNENQQFGQIFGSLEGEGRYGMGTAASKVYGATQGVSVGGYGEALYQNKEGDQVAESDFLRAVLYFGYKYSENWVFNSEIEIEHASTGQDGETSVEFAYLDYLHHDAFNLRAGLLLVPVGLLNELHEPTAFLGTRRPDVESRIIPTTWRSNGIGAFGDATDWLSYKAYLVTGFDGIGFGSSGLRGGRQKGSKSKADDFAGVLRLDATPTDNLRLGGSVYYGDSGQDLDISVATTIAELHADWHWQGITLRALGVLATVDDVAALNRLRAAGDSEDGVAPPDSEIDSAGEKLGGWYVEAGYDLLNRRESGEKSLTPFVRYEQYDTQRDVPGGFKRSGQNDVTVTTAGLNFKPIDEIVFKADYQFYDDKADALDNQFNLSMGYVF